ncbi:unnamed protein product [Nyctereutes procyonoides]|uniref:(raccoon dog) hypothetical protein n=1 Tax=Nyctereutes procyonoides TaxID=34880 RepID=A0A811ZHA7_NYCPR|nr:unnamed protein product [Nyctereutes procyonoides]CAD7688212.1 unnamed protein product [Nyctereutes procyonoides]
MQAVSKPISVISPTPTRLRKRTSGNSTGVGSTIPQVCSPRRHKSCAAD